MTTHALAQPAPIIDGTLPTWKQLFALGIPRDKAFSLASSIELLHCKLSQCDAETLAIINAIGLRGMLGLVESQPGNRIITEITH